MTAADALSQALAAAGSAASALAAELQTQAEYVASLEVANTELRAQLEALTPQAPTLIGVSVDPYPTGFEQWDAIRVYRVNKAVRVAGDYGAKVVCLTDPGVVSPSQLDEALDQVFSAYPDVQVHWAHGNEVDRKVTDIPRYVDEVAAMRAVIDSYPGASLWIDLTQYNIRRGVSAAFEPVAPYLDGMAASWYPPGREQTPPVFTPYGDYMDAVADLCADWGLSRLACWEFGIPADTSRPDKRPEYSAAAIRYARDLAKTRGLSLDVWCWWNNQVNPSKPDNRLGSDGTAAAIRSFQGD